MLPARKDPCYLALICLFLHVSAQMIAFILVDLGKFITWMYNIEANNHTAPKFIGRESLTSMRISLHGR